MHRRARLIALGLQAALCVACGPGAEVRAANEAASPRRSAACPAQSPARPELPNTPAALSQVGYWRTGEDSLLLDSAALAVHEEALRTGSDGAPRSVDLQHTPTDTEVRSWLDERLASYKQLFASGEYVRDAAAEAALAAAARSFVPTRALHVALAPIDLRCIPLAGQLRAVKGSDGFDRNRCSQARVQEPIELLGTVDGGFRLARTRYAFGFIPADAPLSPKVPEALAARYRRGAPLSLAASLTLAGQPLPEATLLRTDDAGRALIATRDGIHGTRSLTPSEARPTRRPLTRHAFLTEAFRYVGSPYGWGDQNGGRDCSRFVLDVLASFGLSLPRTSVHQRESGRYTIDVPAEASEIDRLALLDAAHERGVTLVHFPGHILFYLGRDRDGVPRALHSFAEYLEPCPGGGETLVDVNRVTVSDLSLGQGTSRRSFLERATHVTVFGKPPGYELLALSRFRPPVPPPDLTPKRCGDSADVAIYTSPRAPDRTRPLRAVVVSKHDLRPAGVFLVSPSGTLHAPPQHDLGVGPFARWVEQPNPEPGKWRVLYADGESTFACEEVLVGSARPAPAPRPTSAPAWRPGMRWQRDTERLFAAFVEQLFDHPVDDTRSWSGLSELLRDPARNLLFDHRGLDEDVRLDLQPDCADLPYLLRAYFAWKVGLPFAYRPCTRGKEGVPPRCQQLLSHADALSAPSELAAFERFWRQLRDTVHSASGRTVPGDQVSDLYPLPLTRGALTPGSVFIDPYGHMIVVAKWLPQGLSGHAMLLGADAQPDAMVGRRRFWRGNFLFTPDTRDVGAGFKGFRPVVQDKSGSVTALDDATIEASQEFIGPSRAQYEGDLDAFYMRMDQLIYPRPVALEDRMARAVDALDEQVKRRVEAIDTGEAGLRERTTPIDMPEGFAIFETSGPWEDFATPSRDMRLLIAIDAVRALPAQVRAAPARFGLEPGAPELAEVDAMLQKRLAARRFSYTRSDGTSFSLSLADVTDRMALLETAYNPNDCAESRWGAPEGSEERKPCKRQAPAAQRAQLERYRPWFHARTRPARP